MADQEHDDKAKKGLLNEALKERGKRQEAERTIEVQRAELERLRARLGESSGISTDDDQSMLDENTLDDLADPDKARETFKTAVDRRVENALKRNRVDSITELSQEYAVFNHDNEGIRKIAQATLEREVRDNPDVPPARLVANVAKMVEGLVHAGPGHKPKTPHVPPSGSGGAEVSGLEVGDKPPSISPKTPAESQKAMEELLKFGERKAEEVLRRHE